MTVILVTVGIGYAWLAGAAAGVTFVAVVITFESLQGRMPTALGAAVAFTIVFLAFAPLACTNTGTETRCEAFLFGVVLPGYSGTGAAFSPGYSAPIVLGAIASLSFVLVAERTR
jgi:hypothetical protein